MWSTKLPVQTVLRCSLTSQINRKAPVAVANFHTSGPRLIKDIQQIESNGEITIKGVQKPSPRSNSLLKLPTQGSQVCTTCPVCRLGSGIEIRHTDVLILQQFCSSDGKLLPKSITGLCREQHKRMRYLIVMARHALLLPKVLPDGTVDPTASIGWRANNKYYEEWSLDDMMYNGRKKL